MRAAATPPARARRSTATPRTIRKGPHDQPQSMCPAFGSLRVGLRMRRTATILSGSACCVYGLTFTSHFYGARRTVGYVPFNSETLVTGKLFEDIREAVFKLADPDALRRDRRHQSLRADRVRRAAAAAAEGDQRRAHHRHRRAGLRRADACRSQGRAGRRDAAICAHRGRAGAGAGAARRPQRASRRSRCSARCSRPIRSAIGTMLEPMGLAAGPVVPTREWRELYAALDCAAVAAIHPFYTASHPRVRSGRPADRRLGAGRATTARPPGSRRSATPAACRARRSTPPRTRSCRRSAAALAAKPDQGPHHAVGLRRLRAAGRAPADRERRRRALCRHRLPAHALVGAPTANGSRRKGVHVQYRASLEQDLAALREFKPDLAIGTTPVVQKAKEAGDPGALLHQPHLGAAADGTGRRRLARAGRQRGASATRRASTR